MLYDLSDGFNTLAVADGAGEDDLDRKGTEGRADAFDCGDEAETSRDKKRWCGELFTR